MTALNKQALRQTAEKAQEHGVFNMDIHSETVLVILDELESAEKRIAELEARTVCLPKLPVLGSNAEWYEGFAAGASGMRNECADAIRAAGIGVKGE
ncbi:hypothetical protein ACSP9K_002092 [Citrobacter werkmanii]